MTAFPTRTYAAFLFDMDGTILSSIASAERAWTDFANRHGLDVAAFLPTIHGVQSVETIRNLNLPGVDPVAEAAALTQAEIADVAGIDPVTGAADFLAGLPAERWAIVTSAPRDLATARLKAAGLPCPATMVTAEDVARGKPAPDCFLLAAKKLGVAPGDCLVFEDAPAGIAAARAAGADVVVITAVHRQVTDGDWPTIANYADMEAAASADGLVLRPRQPPVST